MNKKIIIIILAVIIFLAVLLVLAGKFGFKREISTINNKKEEKVDGVKYEDNTDESIRKAVAVNDENLCNMIDDIQKKDSCIYSVEIVNHKFDICQQITDEQWQKKCQEAALVEEAEKDSSIDKCSEILTNELNWQCRVNVFKSWADIKKCDGLEEEDKNLCEDIFHLETAIKNVDIEECKTIKNKEKQIDCLDVVNHIDTDKDGSPDVIELKSGTDPLNPQSKPR